MANGCEPHQPRAGSRNERSRESMSLAARVARLSIRISISFGRFIIIISYAKFEMAIAIRAAQRFGAVSELGSEGPINNTLAFE